MTIQTDYPTLPFTSTQEWAKWLSKNHDTANGIWIKFFKKGSGIPSVNFAQALDEALCYGWIDGQSKRLDEKSWLQKFTPRRPKSTWSKRNIEHTDRLIKEGRMQPAGLQAIEAAKADGRWELAYDSPKNMVIPDDFLKELSKDKNAEAFFKTLSKSNVYAITWRLQTAKKSETRERRMKVILEMLAKGEKLH